MPKPRKVLVSLDDTACMSRCVRLVFLCGTDPFSAKAVTVGVGCPVTHPSTLITGAAVLIRYGLSSSFLRAYS
jgi:hypothetical protein